MRRLSRLTTVVVAVLAMLLTWAVPSFAVGNAEAVKKASTYVAAQAATVTDAGVAADALLALAASGDSSLATPAGPLLNVLKTGGPAYAAKSPESAAKLAVTAVALGLDPRNLGGTDLVTLVKSGVRSDGSFGANPGPYASALGMIALTRSDEQVPTAMLRYLVRLANADGGFGFAPGQPSDADNTGMALLGLTTQNDSISARDAAQRATAWAIAQQQADGSWRGYNPVNSTAIVASALQIAGQAQPKAVQFLVGQQLPDGSLPDNGRPNLLATAQAALLLGDTSYATVSAPVLSGATRTPSTSATSSASPAGATSAPSATAQPSASDTSSSAGGVTPTTAASPAATPTKPRDDGNNLLWVLLPILLLGLLVAGGYYLFGPPSRRKDAAASDSDAPAAPSAQSATSGRSDDKGGPTRP